MIERDEAALQALQKMYHDEDYAMDLVKSRFTPLSLGMTHTEVITAHAPVPWGSEKGHGTCVYRD